jgi:hypothetical protein
MPEAITYPIIDAPEDYTIFVGVTSVPGADTDIQKITVTVSRDSETIISVSDYKVNR